MKLLLIEDEQRLAEAITRGLNEEGHSVDLCIDGRSGQAQGRDIDYDVVILDWMLPDRDGISILRAWRAAGLRTPVLMLTARGTVGERVTGLKAGADDYLIKPFDFAELLARLEALHSRGSGQLELWELGGLLLEGRRRVLKFEGREVPLTAREYALLAAVFSQAGEACSRRNLLATVWGNNFDGDPNVLDVYVGYLRGKLRRIGADSGMLETVRGIGFRLRAPKDQA